ncbi:MAG: hypothetical protein AAFX06_14925 [Planctomycetota bacterium]
MAHLNDLIRDAEAAIDYDLVNDPSKCRSFIAAMRKLVLRRPKSVSVDGNPVSLEQIEGMLRTAELWLLANDTAPSGSASEVQVYDMSGIRG